MKIKINKCSKDCYPHLIGSVVDVSGTIDALGHTWFVSTDIENTLFLYEDVEICNSKSA